MSVSKLVLTFSTAEGKKNWTYNYANPQASTVNVKALMSGMIANGSIFAYPPLMSSAAKMVTTSESDYDLD